MNVIENKAASEIPHESPADEHRLRSERIAAQGVQLGSSGLDGLRSGISRVEAVAELAMNLAMSWR
jgi:hypothetical protein